MKKPGIKIGILSLGCPRNLTDSEDILGRLNFKGYPVVDISKADVAIVNTCAFIREAKEESIDAIMDLIGLKKEGRLKKIIVYGCLSQRYKSALVKELPEIDAFIGKISLDHKHKRFPLSGRHYAYLKICEGCVNNCSFCAIPKIKGKFTSLSEESILKEAEELNRQALSEINIIGQDITGYGIDSKGAPGLARLLEKILRQTNNIGWIRLLYLYPSRVDRELLQLIGSSPKICKYVDLPIQHINQRILKLMRRQTSRGDTLRLLDKVRKAVRGVAIRTSVIVGFPSETEKEFRELLKFIEEARFERLGAFIYSREEGTSAYGLKKQLPHKEKVARFNMIMSVQQKISRQINEGLRGKVMDVLIEEKDKNYYLGRTQYDAPEVDGLVYVRSQRGFRPGEFAKVKITDTLEYDLVGEAQ